MPDPVDPADLPNAANPGGLPPRNPGSADTVKQAPEISVFDAPPKSPSDGSTFPPEARAFLRELDLEPASRSPDQPTRTDNGAGAARGTNPPPQSDVPGYEIFGELGRGGMGVVYKARQTKLNRLVALKMISSGSRADPLETVRFLVEAEAAAAVQHPNVVQVYEYGEAGGRPYLALEYLEGGSLTAQLKTTGKMAPADAARVVEQIARGVQAAHNLGIVHRDLKPSNILFAVASGQAPADSSGQDKKIEPSSPAAGNSSLTTRSPKVTDFGLAKRGAGVDVTQTGVVIGTPAYMAPEQAKGQTKFVGPAADVYALGVILYECLTGSVPFTGPDSWSVIQQVIHNEPATVRSRVRTVPRDLDLICQKCLAKEPHARYPSAKELADDLARFLAGKPITARPVSTAARSWKWVKRNPVVAGLLGAVLLVTLGLAGSLVVHYRQTLDRERFERQAKEEAEGLAQTNANLAATERELRKLADAEADRANQVSDFLTGMFRSSDPLDIFGESLIPARWEEQRSKTAETLLREAAKRFNKDKLKGQPLIRAKLLASIGISLLNLGDFQTAEPALREALALRKANLPADNPDVVRSELDLARLLFDTGDFPAALDGYRAAREVQQRTGTDEKIILTTRLYEGITLTMLGKTEAEQVLRDVIAGRERLSGKNHQTTVSAKIALAAFYLDQGRSREALTLAPEIHEALEAQQDGQHRAIGSAFLKFQMGVALANQSSTGLNLLPGIGFGDPEKLLRESLAMVTKDALPSDHFLVNLIRFELARVLEKNGKDDEAEALYNQVVSDVRRTVGLTHPKFLVVLNQYTTRLARTDRLDAARKLYDETIRANLDRFGPENHWRVLLLLDRAQFEAKRDSRVAVECAREALAIARKGKLIPTRRTARELFDAAKGLGHKNATPAAAAVARELFVLTREVVTVVYGNLSAEMVIALRDEGDQLYGRGDLKAATARLAEAEAMLPQIPQPLREEDQNYLCFYLGRAAADRGDVVAAEQYFRRALDLSRRFPATELKSRSEDASYLAGVLVEQGKFAEAVPLLEDARRWTVASKASQSDIATADRLLAVTRLAAADRDGYLATVRSLVRRYDSSTSIDLQARLAWTAAIAPNADWKPAETADRLRSLLVKFPKFDWGHRAHALARLRAGDTDGVIDALRRVSGPELSVDHLIRGLAALGAGDRATAHAYMRKAEQAIAAARPSPANAVAYQGADWSQRLVADLLYAELRAGVGPPPVAPPPRVK